MPAFDVALLELGHLLGIFKSSGDVDWEWFGGPVAKAFAALPTERERIGALVRALLDRGAPSDPFLDGVNWEPILNLNNIGLGFTWNASNSPASDPLDIGLGAKANIPISGQQITLAALARLIEILGQNVTPQLGQVKLGGTFPVPSFLSSGEITADIAAPNVTVGLKATDTQSQSRQLEYPNPVLPWDLGRFALFVLRAWIKQRADANETFFKRINDHAFPMLGDPPGAIHPFPLVGPMKSAPIFDDWSGSVLTTSQNGVGALTFLWHLRALLTGNESPNFINGSYYFPLSGAPQSGGVPSLADGSGLFQPPMGTNGAWIGIDDKTTPGTLALVLHLETTSPSRTCRIPLATWNGSTFARPSLDSSWQNIVTFISSTPGLAIGNELIKAATAAPGFRLSLLRTTVSNAPNGFNGDYDVALYLESGKGVQFVLGIPNIDIQFPPELNDLQKLLGDLGVWLLNAAVPNTDLGHLITSAAEFLRKTLTHTSPDPLDLLMKVAAVVGQGQKIEIELGNSAKATIEIKNGKVNAGVEFGPIESDTIPISVGTINGGIVVNPVAAPILDGFTVGFDNLRLSNSGTGSGVIATLIPDMRQFAGFHLSVEYSSQKLKVTGGGKIPIQQTLGPLEIAALLIDVREESFSVAIDLSFELAAISVTAYELGIRYNFRNGGSIEPFLHGLGLSMDTGAIKLAGFFAAIETNGVTDYVGGATVSIAGYFELSAIGGYTQLQDGTASLFIFAALIAPLGGPPWFFITGVAGGFGYNRSLPAPGLMLDHPFLKVMRGEIAVGKDAAEDLKTLSVHFAAMKGQHWIAAGIQFTAFGFINGKVVVAIGFGNKFSLTVLGMASFGIKPLIYFEIGIEATADEEKFLLRARISPNSYVIHPDIFSLQGDFCLGAWYKDPHKGDFLFSIGGYHPLFKKPEHYPDLIRAGCKAVIYSFVHLTVEVFFTCTPQALMAGASVSLWAEFVGIKAGLDVYVDVLMKWDPFSLRARMGIHIWFEFWGRHEVGVDLDIWTPEFGGVATIDLAIVSFDVDFGHPLIGEQPPKIFEFISKQLGVPSKEWNGGARCADFTTDAGSGLFRVEFLSGRPGKEPPDKDEKQEGLDANAPVLMSPEWSFLVRSRLPMGGVNVDVQPPFNNGQLESVGQVDLPLCGEDNLSSTLGVKAAKIDQSVRTWLADYFPAANFGEPVPEAQASARDSVANLKTDKPSIALVEGMIVNYNPLVGNPPTLTAPLGEPSDKNYPLPLGAPQQGGIGVIKNRYAFVGAAALPVKFASGVTRRSSALQDLRTPVKRPFHVLSRVGDVQRFTKLSASRTFSVNAGGIPVMTPPPSPIRPQEMFAVQLRALPIRSSQPAQRRQMETLTRAKGFKETRLTPREGSLTGLQTTLGVVAGKATQVDFPEAIPSGARLRFSSDQTVRVLVLNRGGSLMLDSYARGSVDLPLPPAARQAILIGEGLTNAPTNAGIERESILLAAASRSFIGHGCFATVQSQFDLEVRTFDSLPGADLFARAKTLRIFFAPVREEATLVLKLVPTVTRPAPAVEQVRWRASGAEFRDLFPVLSTERVAFLMTVRAPKAWSVDIDLGPEWNLDGVALVQRNARVLLTELRTNPNWDLVDDSMPVHPRGLSTAVRLEAKP